MSEVAQLAPTTRLDESPKDRKGLSIHYYINVHCEVSMAKDLIVKIPFIISGNERSGLILIYSLNSINFNSFLFSNHLIFFFLSPFRT